MILTRKAKEAFETWLDEYSQNHHKKEWLDNDLYLDEVYLPDEVLNALIIEWLDSVGIYVSTEYIYGEHFSCCVETLEQTTFTKGDTRQQATEKAIERAVELFNERS